MNNPKIYPLTEPQMQAVEPIEQIWLSAAAGTGKTQVLSARVLRLLLQKNVRPEDILCITFTKAGAAEMANRINKRLASWVRMKGTRLGLELASIGADNGPETQNRARQLFASLLDAPGGGVRVMTIHSFCQTLLSSFPGEAQLNHGFRAIEDREQAILLRDAFNLMCEENSNDAQFVAALEELSLQYGEDRALNYLQKWANNPNAAAYWNKAGEGEAVALYLVGCSIKGDANDYLMNACQDDNFDRAAVRACAALNMQWGTKRGIERAQIINDWLALDTNKRSQSFAALHGAWSKDNGQIVQAKSKGHTPPYDDYEELAIRLFDWSNEVQSQIQLYDLAQRLNANFTVGKKFAQYYQHIKDTQALVDYDDLIRKSAELLTGANMADWIRYKLDQRIDHILIDEAQDTNQSQWDIIKAISDDFYSGEAAQDDKLRTIFTVGDFKQAIFGFQGTSPQNYSHAQHYFDEKLRNANLQLNNLILSQSFRSTKPILDFVNKMIENQGHEKFGLDQPIEDHFGGRKNIGEIILLEPVKSIHPDDEDANSDANRDTNSDQDWLAEEKRVLADKLADYIAQMLNEKHILDTTNEPIRPKDIMILLRRRSDLASLLVARLHSKNVPVAGIDRLYLSKPLAVQDLLTTIRFVLQPDDDLNLATLLTSPLIGLDHDELLNHGYRQKNISLWQHIRRDKALEEQIYDLRTLLDMADYGSPYQFLEKILSGPLQGRKKLYARLGSEAEMAINELLNSALEYSRSQGQSLQGFLDWMVRGDVEIKRENSGDHDEVRVMTVHGSKGLQAPVVILADICSNPINNNDNSFEFNIGIDEHSNKEVKLPIPSLDKQSRIGKIGEAYENHQKSELEEHNRLLYVALTRSEERLILAGSLGKREKAAHELSWYHPLKTAMEGMESQEIHDDIWGVKYIYSGSEQSQQKKLNIAALPMINKVDEETAAWLYSSAPQESRPPKPLAPSHIIEDDASYSPAAEHVKKYAMRGNLIHNLFEFLLSLKSDDPNGAAMRWFERQQNEALWSANDIIKPVIKIITDKQYAHLFGSNSRSEVPIAAVVGDIVVNGRIDQLVVADDEIIALDYKTGSKVPENIDEIPTAYMRQMAHYAAALEVIFPNKKVQTALLYTHAPKLFMLNDVDIAPFKPQNAAS